MSDPGRTRMDSYASPVSIPDLSPDAYKAATPAIQAILQSAKTIRWFPVLPAGDPPEAVQESARNHLRRLAELFPANRKLGDTSVRWIRGDLEFFDRACPPITDTEGWGDPFGPTTWGRFLGQLARDLHKVIEESPELTSLLGPPLWPLPGKLVIVSSAIFSDPPPRELQAEQRWALLSHVQYNFYHTLEWALAAPATVVDSPFYHLWQIHLAGYYPLGIRNGHLDVYSRDA